MPARPAALRALALLTVLLLAAALWTRGIEARLPPVPTDEAGAGATIAAPMQLLSRGATRRADELEQALSPERREAWRRYAAPTLELRGCPRLRDFLDGGVGQGLERLLGDLRRGSREEALAALALVVHVARATGWSPGFLGDRPEDAERLGGLLEEWLRVWAPRAANDALLYEPALAAAMLYGRALRTAYDAPSFGRNRASYERARVFLETLTGAGASRRTDFGDALLARHQRAYRGLTGEDDFLRGFEEEARLLFPDVTGTCP